MSKANRNARGKEAHAADVSLIREIKSATKEYQGLAKRISDTNKDDKLSEDQKVKIVSDAVAAMKELSVKIEALDDKVTGPRKYDTRR